MSLVKSQLRRQTVCCHFDVGGHNRAHGGRVPRVPRGGYAPAFYRALWRWSSWWGYNLRWVLEPRTASLRLCRNQKYSFHRNIHSLYELLVMISLPVPLSSSCVYQVVLTRWSEKRIQSVSRHAGTYLAISFATIGIKRQLVVFTIIIDLRWGTWPWHASWLLTFDTKTRQPRLWWYWCCHSYELYIYHSITMA